MPAWLLKSDPETYGFDELMRDRETVWDGVANPVARKNLRAMKPGDLCLVYHTGDEKAVIGMATVTQAGDPDPTLRAGARLKRPVTLAELRKASSFQGSPLIRQVRLSVVPLDETQLAEVRRLSGDSAGGQE